MDLAHGACQRDSCTVDKWVGSWRRSQAVLTCVSLPFPPHSHVRLAVGFCQNAVNSIPCSHFHKSDHTLPFALYRLAVDRVWICHRSLYWNSWSWWWVRWFFISYFHLWSRTKLRQKFDLRSTLHPWVTVYSWVSNLFWKSSETCSACSEDAPLGLWVHCQR